MHEDESVADSLEEEGFPRLVLLRSPKKRKIELVAGDIVWAAYRGVYWPAAIRSVFRKKRRGLMARVMFFDRRGSNYRYAFTLGLEDIDTRFDYENNLKYTNNPEGVSEDDLAEIDFGVKLADRYLRWKNSGDIHTLTPLQYMKACSESSNWIFAPENWKKFTSDYDDEENKTNDFKELFLNADSDDDSTKSESRSLDSSNEDNEENSDELRENEKLSEKIITRWILTPECLEHVKAQLEGPEPCTRLKLHKEGASQIKKLKNMGSMGPLSHKLKRQEMTHFLADNLDVGMNHMLLFYVCVPEAVMYALQKEFAVDRETAETSLLNSTFPKSDK